ncbi:MAG: NPCBM/NEW2 domain-containing protein [Chloroflexi bacterium]|nr:NPCBM/NEW2 domain-containing protein [Chloroflexota bacterium]
MTPRTTTGFARLLRLTLALMMLVPALGMQSAPHVPAPEAAAADRLLTDLPWQHATAGWIAPGVHPGPRLNQDLWAQPLTIQGVVYEKGLAAFPVSEIAYALTQPAAVLRGVVGLHDGAPAGGESARFVVEADGVPVWDSGIRRRGEEPLPFEAPLAGARTLRLIIVEGDPGDTGGEGVWAALRLVAGDAAAQSRARSAFDQLSTDWQTLRTRQSAAGRQAQDAAASTLRLILYRAGLPDNLTGAWGGLDETTGSQVLANGNLAVVVSGAPQVQGVNLVALPERVPVLLRAVPALAGPDGRPAPAITRGASPRPDDFTFTPGSDPATGHTMTLDLHYSNAELAELGIGELHLWLTLGDTGRTLTYRAAADGGMTPSAVTFFDGAQLAMGGSAAAEYLTDADMLRQGQTRDDGLVRWEPIGMGKPLAVRPEGGTYGLLLGVIDPVDAPARAELRWPVGAPYLTLTLHQPLRAGTGVNAPRLFLEVTAPEADYQVFTRYRETLGRLYPARPLPAWFRSQWLSWYPNFMEINDAWLRSQVDQIADQMGGLGPWHIIVDAGWYLTEGRAGSDWRHVDADKFPNGLRSFVDYAHSRGVKVVLFFSAPYLDNGGYAGNWLGLSSFIEQHPEWLLPLGPQLGPQGEVDRYVVDYQHPELRAEMDRLIRSFFEDYGVDGLKLDGMGWAEGEVRDLATRGYWTPEDAALGRGQTMDIYQVVAAAAQSAAGPDAYIESGWVTPPYAAPYVQTFRYGDEAPAWSSPYPFPGLLEHLDYAVYQTLALGQHANIGAVYGDPGDHIGVQWLDAALATGAQVSLSFDLHELDPDLLAAYRSRLAAIRPFAGKVTAGPGWQPDAVANNDGDRVFLAQINRQAAPRAMTTPLSDLQLPTGRWAAYQPGPDRALAVQGAVQGELPGDGLLLTVLRSTPGLLWTTSDVTPGAAGPDERSYMAAGPADLPGLLVLAADRPGAVLLDGEPLIERATGAAGAGWRYDADAGVLRIDFTHTGAPVQVTIMTDPAGRASDAP